MDKRVFLFPLCSGILCFLNVVMQIVAVSTPYWAHFKRERYMDTAENTDPLYEEGHYGLWTICLTVFDGNPLEVEDCSANFVHFHPSSWRVFAGIIAIINVVLSLLFLTTIPLQFHHLKLGRFLFCKFKTLTKIKVVLSLVGAICAVMAAILFGIHSHHKNYKEPKGWSFGLQLISVVIEVFLLICCSAETVMAHVVDGAPSPGPQFLFTIPEGAIAPPPPPPPSAASAPFAAPPRPFSYKGKSKTLPLPVSHDDDYPLVAGLANQRGGGGGGASFSMGHRNPVFLDSDEMNVVHDDLFSAHALKAIELATTGTASRGGASSIGRFKVDKIADLFTQNR